MANLFSLNNIAPTTTNFTTIGDLNISDIEESYFEAALDYVLELKKEYNKNKEVLYTSLVENAGDVNCINESFESFFSNIVKIIDKFIKFIKGLFDKFNLYLNKMVSSDKYIKNNKSEFNKFTDDHEFTYSGYQYSFHPNIPLMIAQTEYMEDFFSIGEGVSVKDVYYNLHNKLKDDFFDKFRGNVIASENHIPYSDFHKELYKLYRNNEDEKEDIEITSIVVMQALTDFLNNSQMEKDIKAAKNKLNDEYESIKKYLKKSTNISDLTKPIEVKFKGSDGVERTANVPRDEYLNYFNLFIKAKTDQIEQMSTIHAMAFGAKLDALKDMYKQNRAILYTALSKVKKGSAK